MIRFFKDDCRQEYSGGKTERFKNRQGNFEIVHIPVVEGNTHCWPVNSDVCINEFKHLRQTNDVEVFLIKLQMAPEGICRDVPPRVGKAPGFRYSVITASREAVPTKTRKECRNTRLIDHRKNKPPSDSAGSV